MSEIIVAGNSYHHVHVIVDGQTGTHSFANVEITRHLNALGSTFNITFPNRWIDSQSEFIFTAGKRIRVILRDKNVLIDGFIEKISTEVSDKSHLIRIEGRDKTGDLVDCSPGTADEFTNLTLAQIAERVCKPFNIKVFDQAKDPHQFPKAKFRPAETVFNFLNRLSKQRGILLNSTSIAGGGLTLVRPGQYRYRKERLDYRNILTCSTSVDISKIYSKYTILSQTNNVVNIEDEQGEIEQETNVVATVTDSTARRKIGPNKYIERPMTMISEKQATNIQAASRASWEQVKRLGEMLKIDILVNGWLTRDGDIWRVNRKIKVEYPHAGLDGTYLIASCKYIYGFNESIKTQLTLTHGNAYAPAPGTEIKADPDNAMKWDFTKEGLERWARQRGIPTSRISVGSETNTSERQQQ